VTAGVSVRLRDGRLVIGGAPLGLGAALPWRRERSIVGIHSGRPTLTDVGYIGLAVHTTARVCSAARGGQIVVSAETRAAVRDSAPAGVRFRALGRHGLPGRPDPQMLFQVHAKGLLTGFPRSRTGRRPASLPSARRCS